MQNLKVSLLNIKIAMLTIAFIFITQYVEGQNGNSRKKIKRSYIRIYHFDGKVSRGTLFQISDSTLILQMSHDGIISSNSIHYKEIAFVKKGRSILHHFFVKGIIGFGIALPIAAISHETMTAGVQLTNSVVSPISGTGQPFIPEPESHVFSNSLKVGLLVGLISAVVHSPDEKKLHIDGSLEKFKEVSKTLNYLSK